MAKRAMLPLLSDMTTEHRAALTERQQRLLAHVDTRVAAGLDRPYEVAEHVRAFGATMRELEEAESRGSRS